MEYITNSKKETYVYSLKPRLGNGSFGEVWLGIRLDKPNVPLAIKNICKPTNEEQNKRLMQSFEREKRILLEIDHPNIVKLYDAFLSPDNKYLYFIYELCIMDLEKYLQRETVQINEQNERYLSEEEVIWILNEICNGYHILLDKNVLHRDIKPANLVFGNGRLKLADFGTSREFTNVKKGLQEKGLTQGVGTIVYSAPEALFSEVYNEKCDLWSVGILIYELLYGKLPWECPKNGFLHDYIKTHDLKFPVERKRSIKIKMLISRMLTFDCGKRMNWKQLFEEVNSFESIGRALGEESQEEKKIEIPQENNSALQKKAKKKKSSENEESKSNINKTEIEEILKKQCKSENERRLKLEEINAISFNKRLSFFYKECLNLLQKNEANNETCLIQNMKFTEMLREFFTVSHEHYQNNSFNNNLIKDRYIELKPSLLNWLNNHVKNNFGMLNKNAHDYYKFLAICLQIASSKAPGIFISKSELSLFWEETEGFGIKSLYFRLKKLL